MLYADTSALAKLILSEPESTALRAYLGDDPGLVASALVVTELGRAARRLRPEVEHDVAGLLETVALIDVDEEILAAAARVAPAELRTLDAIHLVTALSLGVEVDALVTYDQRMAVAARSAGLRVEAPA